jgi:hypothetical protein
MSLTVCTGTLVYRRHHHPHPAAAAATITTTTTIKTTTNILNKIEEARCLPRIIDDCSSEQALTAYQVAKLCFSQHSDHIVLLQNKRTPAEIKAL